MKLSNREIQAIRDKIVEELNEKQEKLIEDAWIKYKESDKYKGLLNSLQKVIDIIQEYNTPLPDDLKVEALYFGCSHVSINMHTQKCCEEVIENIFRAKYPRYNVFRTDVEDEIVLRSIDIKGIDELIASIVSHFLSKNE